MSARGQSSTARRHRIPPRSGSTLAVFHHASSDVLAHVARLRRLDRYRVACRGQHRAAVGAPPSRVGVVLWELAPGRRPNWCRLKSIAQGSPIVSYSANHAVAVADRSRELGFATHLTAPLNPVQIAHQITIAAPVDLVARWWQARSSLERYLRRVEPLSEITRHVAASLELSPVAEALVSRLAAWLPASDCAVVGWDEAGAPTILAATQVVLEMEPAADDAMYWVKAHGNDGTQLVGGVA